MKKNSFLILMFLVVLLSGCTNVTKRANRVDTWKTIKQKDEIVIGLDDSFVPMGFREKNGSLVGYDIDLATEVFKRLGLKPSFQTIDWSMAETELRNGTIDAIWNGYTKTSQRSKKVAFSKPYLKNRQILVSKKDEKILYPIDMRKKTLGLQAGSSGYQAYMNYPQKLKKYVKETIEYDTFNNAFLDLNANRIQGLLIDSVYANYYIAHQKNAKNYRKINVGFESEDFVVGVRKGDKTLQKKINNTLKEMKNDGTMKKISLKWFGVDNSTDFGKD